MSVNLLLRFPALLCMYDKQNPVNLELASVKEPSGRNLIIVIVFICTDGNETSERSKKLGALIVETRHRVGVSFRSSRSKMLSSLLSLQRVTKSEVFLKHFDSAMNICGEGRKRQLDQEFIQVSMKISRFDVCVDK
ncbi:Uncharacterized protein Fot_24062 [Forsythia ovata]|uniref:Uncharacterized protein n=1 Tax=Forsythia ovata TaxID=205694 RepID=A0ABD1U550_9LAMI